MRRPVSERDAVRSQVIDVLEAQEMVEEPVHEQQEVSTADPGSTCATKGGAPARLFLRFDSDLKLAGPAWTIFTCMQWKEAHDQTEEHCDCISPAHSHAVN